MKSIILMLQLLISKPISALQQRAADNKHLDNIISGALEPPTHLSLTSNVKKKRPQSRRRECATTKQQPLGKIGGACWPEILMHKLICFMLTTLGGWRVRCVYAIKIFINLIASNRGVRSSSPARMVFEP